MGAGAGAGVDSRPQTEAGSAEPQVLPAVVTQARGGVAFYTDQSEASLERMGGATAGPGAEVVSPLATL